MAFGMIDQMVYNYDATYGNMLNTITESSLITRGFKKISAGASGYTYDNNGNVNADGYRGITGTTYLNPLNLPVKVNYSATKYIEYTYDMNERFPLGKRDEGPVDLQAREPRQRMGWP